MLLFLGQLEEGGIRCIASFAHDLHGPTPHVGVGVVERDGFRLAERVERPQGFERVRRSEPLAERRREFLEVAPADLEDGLLAEPGIAVTEVTQQLRRRAGVQVERLELRGFADRAHAVEPSAFLVPVVRRLHVAEAGVVPIREVDRAIRTDPGPDRPEPAIRTGDQVGFVVRTEGGACGEACADVDFVGEGVGGDDAARIFLPEQSAFVDGESLREAAGLAFALHVFEPTERVRIGERAVLAPALDPIAALLVVHAARRAVVRAGEDAAFAVDLEAVSVAAAFGMDFEDLANRMEAPDALAFPADVLAAPAADVPRGGAAVGSVEPAVHAPLQAGRGAVRVLEAEAAELDFGVADRESALGGIAEEIRRVQHPHASHAGQGGGGDVEAFQDIGPFVERPGALRVFEDADDVGPFLAAGRRQGDFIELGADVFVVADDLEPGREGVLEVLSHPEAPL